MVPHKVYAPGSQLAGKGQSRGRFLFCKFLSWVLSDNLSKSHNHSFSGFQKKGTVLTHRVRYTPKPVPIIQ